MTDFVLLTSAEPVVWGVLKLVWSDGYAGVVDLRPVISDGEAFAFLRRDPSQFAGVRLAPDGYYLYWLDDDGEEIDFGSESLRRRAEQQAEVLRLAG